MTLQYRYWQRIVRFRTAVKDQLDIVYMFWGNFGGYCDWGEALPGFTTRLCHCGGSSSLLSRRKIREQHYLLIIRHTDESIGELRTRLRQLNYQVKSKTVRKNFMELTLEMRLRDDNTAFVNELSRIEGVQYVSLINYTGDYAQ